MHKRLGAASRAALIAVATAMVVATGVVAQERDRAKIPVQDTWNLADIYPADAAWRAAKEKFAADLPRLYVYASMLADQDTRDASHQAMRQEMVQPAAAFFAEIAYIEPALLRAGKPAIEGFSLPNRGSSPTGSTSRTSPGGPRTR